MFRMHRLILQGCKRQSDDFKTHTCKSQGSKVHDEFFFEPSFFYVSYFYVSYFSIVIETFRRLIFIHLRYHPKKLPTPLHSSVRHGIHEALTEKLS